MGKGINTMIHVFCSKSWDLPERKSGEGLEAEISQLLLKHSCDLFVLV